jgi:hypothetical protein
MVNLIDSLVQVGVLEDSDISEYIRNTPGLDAIYPILVDVNKNNGTDVADLLAAFLVVGYKIGTVSDDVQDTDSEIEDLEEEDEESDEDVDSEDAEIETYDNVLDEISACIEEGDYTTASEIIADLKDEILETDEGVVLQELFAFSEDIKEKTKKNEVANSRTGLPLLRGLTVIYA